MKVTEASTQNLSYVEKVAKNNPSTTLSWETAKGKTGTSTQKKLLKDTFVTIEKFIIVCFYSRSE